MSYKKVIHLTQITPLIHFQSEEPGACLRASEVKPKLDRFIINELKRSNVKIIPSFYIDEANSEALDYKMRFRVCGEAT
ncbi:MAG: hypothetical protein RSE20_09570, partial [Eubacterium sp.]